MITTISVKEAQEIISKKKAVILDVRTPEEFDEEQLPGAVNIDLHSEDFEERIMKLDKKKTYLVHCHSGRRSAMAAHLMEEKGFTKVYNVVGLVFGH